MCMKCPLIKEMKFILGKHSFHFFIHISRDGNGFIVYQLPENYQHLIRLLQVHQKFVQPEIPQIV